MDKHELDEVLESFLDNNLIGTDFPDLGKRDLGKVRDNYVDGGSRIIVMTDRLCAFDTIVGTIPFKGQVHNQLAQYWLETSTHLAPNHLITVPDPNCMIGNQCKPLGVTFTLRGYLTRGRKLSLSRMYKRGVRKFGSVELPDGLRENESLPEPVLTLACDAWPAERDTLITREQVLEADAVTADVVTAERFDQALEYARALFAFGQEHAAERWLILAEASYEFGVDAVGQLRVIHEFHTWDTARYWRAEDYDARFSIGQQPRGLDGQYPIQWLVEVDDYHGEGIPPELPDEIRVETARRYIEVYEKITWRDFEPDLDEQPQTRVARNLGCI